MEIQTWAAVGGVQGEKLILGYFEIFLSFCLKRRSSGTGWVCCWVASPEGSWLDVAVTMLWSHFLPFPSVQPWDPSCWISLPDQECRDSGRGQIPTWKPWIYGCAELHSAFQAVAPNPSSKQGWCLLLALLAAPGILAASSQIPVVGCRLQLLPSHLLSSVINRRSSLSLIISQCRTSLVLAESAGEKNGICQPPRRDPVGKSSQLWSGSTWEFRSGFPGAFVALLEPGVGGCCPWLCSQPSSVSSSSGNGITEICQTKPELSPAPTLSLQSPLLPGSWENLCSRS